MKFTAYLLLLFVLLVFTDCESNKPENKLQNKSIENIDTAGISLNYLDSLHKRKTFKSHDISLIEYIRSNPNKPDSIRKVIYLLPLGNMNPEIENIIKDEIEYLKVFFQLDVKLLERLSFDDIKKINAVKTRLVPANDYEYYSKIKDEAVDLREQIEANSIIDNYMIQNKPKDAVAVLGITEHDLYLPKYNYIFGTSNIKNGLGIISTYRVTDYPNEIKNNIRKITSKQIANLFSISNVKDYICLLNFHENIDALQNGVFYISPRALEKLKYSIGFNYDKRFSKLRDIWKKEGNRNMEKYYTNCLKLTKK